MLKTLVTFKNLDSTSRHGYSHTGTHAPVCITLEIKSAVASSLYMALGTEDTTEFILNVTKHHEQIVTIKLRIKQNFFLQVISLFFLTQEKTFPIIVCGCPTWIPFTKLVPQWCNVSFCL